MASVRKSSKSRFWYACITGPDGKQKQFSTGLEDRDEAFAAAVDAERVLKRHVAAPHRLREALDRIAREYTPASDIDPGPWLRAWAESRRKETAKSTGEVYAGVAKDAAQWMAANDVVSFSELTPARVLELREFWTKKNHASTANTKIKILRIALRVAVTAKLIEANPADGLIKLKQKKTTRRDFRDAELKLLAASLTGEWKAVFQLGLNTGQRLNDLTVLRWRQLDIAAGTITFHAQKTGMLVCLPLLPASILALEEIPSADSLDDFAFPVLAKLKRSARSNQFRELLAAVGLSKKVSHRKDDEKTSAKQTVSELSFHSLRHTTTSLLKSAGVSEAVAMAIVGHASKAVSNTYTHVDFDTLKKAMEKMPAF